MIPGRSIKLEPKLPTQLSIVLPLENLWMQVNFVFEIIYNKGSRRHNPNSYYIYIKKTKNLIMFGDVCV